MGEVAEGELVRAAEVGALSGIAFLRLYFLNVCHLSVLN